MSESVWKTLATGVEIIYVPDLAGAPKTPEVAILRLDETEYEKFHADPHAYLEQQKVFPFKLLTVFHVHHSAKTVNGAKTNNSMIVVNIHKVDCAVLSVSQAEGS